jgi:hypothetical protein
MLQKPPKQRLLRLSAPRFLPRLNSLAENPALRRFYESCFWYRQKLVGPLPDEARFLHERVPGSCFGHDQTKALGAFGGCDRGGFFEQREDEVLPAKPPSNFQVKPRLSGRGDRDRGRRHDALWIPRHRDKRVNVPGEIGLAEKPPGAGKFVRPG